MMEIKLCCKMIARLILLSSVMLFIISCEREPNEIGLNLQPGSDRMELFCDTLDVETYTVLDDSIASDERTLSPLGSYFDPTFGFCKADFFTQVRLSSANVNFSDVVETADSLVLHLFYNGYYGDTTTVQKIRVYEVINKDILIDSTYYSNYRFDQADLSELCSIDITPHPSDSFVNITMPQSLIDRFMNASNVSSFVSNDTFLDFFKGFYITTDNVNNGGAILYFNLLSANSEMTFYYNDSLSFDFPINASTARINMFEHDYSLASTEIQQTIDNLSEPNTMSFLQSMGGLRVKFYIKGLEGLDTLRYAVNKAQLLVTVNRSNEMGFEPPPSLTLVSINEEGLNEFLTDYKINSSYFGGKLNETDYTYTFNIPFHLQELILNQNYIDNGIYLFPLDNRTNASRVTIYGGNSPSNAMKVIIMYSKF